MEFSTDQTSNKRIQSLLIVMLSVQTMAGNNGEDLVTYLLTFLQGELWWHSVRFKLY